MAMVALMIVLGCVLLGEGSTILRCLPAVTASGPQRLTRLGSWFLATEVWVVVLIGLLNAIAPGILEHDGLLWPLVAFVAGWMARDLGLWLGPRTRMRILARIAVSAGAAVQAGAVIAAGLVLALDWPGSGTGSLHPWVAPLAVMMVLMVLAIQGVWLTLLRERVATWFNWLPVEQVNSVRG